MGLLSQEPTEKKIRLPAGGEMRVISNRRWLWFRTQGGRKEFEHTLFLVACLPKDG